MLPLVLGEGTAAGEEVEAAVDPADIAGLAVDDT